MTQDDDIKALRGAINWNKTTSETFGWRDVAHPARIARLLDRLEAAEADAGRYRWLRDAPTGSRDTFTYHYFNAYAADLDAAIDRERAAMQEGAP